MLLTDVNYNLAYVSFACKRTTEPTETAETNGLIKPPVVRRLTSWSVEFHGGSSLNMQAGISFVGVPRCHGLVARARSSAKLTR